MARRRMVTRTIKGTQAEVLTVNINTAETATATVLIGATYNDEKKLFKAIEKVMSDNPEIKPVHVITSTQLDKCFGMPEEEFLKIAKELDPATRKAIEEAGEDVAEGEETEHEPTDAKKTNKTDKANRR